MLIKKLDQQVVHQLRANLNITSIEQCLLELLQNSIDAGSSQIQVILSLEKSYIQVDDNGIGIQPDDMRQLGQRYVTSKCRSLQDLSMITTFGFRGEALASIGELATVEICSLHKDYFDSYSCQIKGGKVKYDGLTRFSKRQGAGTSVIIRDIFYNYPVKRKYYQTKRHKIQDIKRAVEILFMPFPQINVIIRDDSYQKIMILERRSPIVGLRRFSGNFQAKLQRVTLKKNDKMITGFISLYGHPNQMLGKLEDSPLPKYPVYALELNCSPTSYDICLDPAKSIVEFENWDEILLLFTELISDFLTDHNLIKEKSQINSASEQKIIPAKSCFFDKQKDTFHQQHIRRIIKGKRLRRKCSSPSNQKLDKTSVSSPAIFPAVVGMLFVVDSCLPHSSNIK
ncbi:DNA mismatch repair protein, partial [Basidiobolus ranarum]